MTKPIALSPFAALMCLALSSPSSAAPTAVVATVPTPAASDVATSATTDERRAILEGAPEAKKVAFSVGGEFAMEGVKIDAYWNVRPTTKASN